MLKTLSQERNERNRWMVNRCWQFIDEMKDNPTEAEQLLCNALSSSPYKDEFVFQYPIYLYDRKGFMERFYIADFYIPSKHLIIELDGKHHAQKIQHIKDSIRDYQINYMGYTVLRFDNIQIFRDRSCSQILRKIYYLE